MIYNIRETGHPRMDRLDDIASNAEKNLTKASCFVVPAPLAGVAKVVMGIFQTALGSLGTLYSIGMKDDLLKERWITHIQNGLGNIGRGILEAIPFLGLCIHFNMPPFSRETPGLFEPSYDGQFNLIHYPSIQIRTWKIVDPTGAYQNETSSDTQKLEETFHGRTFNVRIELNEKFETIKTHSVRSLKERVKILDKILNDYMGSEKSDRFAGKWPKGYQAA